MSSRQAGASRWGIRSAGIALVVGLLLIDVARLGPTLGNVAIHEDQYREFVVPALGMFSGDLNPHRFVYGSLGITFVHLVWRLHYLALRLVAPASGIHNVAEYVARFYAAPGPFYVVAGLGLWGLRLAAAALLYLAARRIGGAVAGLTATTLFLLHRVGAGYALSFSPDTVSAFCTAAVLWLVVRCPPGGSRFWRDLGVGLALGLCVAAKMLGLFLLPAYLLWRLRSDRADPLRARAGGALIGLLGAGAGFVLGEPYALLDRPELRASTAFQLDFNAATSYPHRLETPLHVLGNLLHPGQDAGPVVLALALVAVLLAARQYWKPTGFIALAGLSGVVFLCLQPVFHRNWLLPIFPALAVLAGLGLASARGWLKGRWPRLAWPGAVALYLVATGPGWFWGCSSLRGLAHRPVVESTPYAWYPCQRWIERTVPRAAALLVVANPQYAPRLLRTPDSPPQPTDAYLGPSRAGAFLRSCQDLAATRWAALRPAYRLYPRLHLWGRRPEDLRGTSLPQAAEVAWQPLDWYAAQGVRYVVVDSAIREQFDGPRWPQDQRFFAELRRRGTIVAQFTSPAARYPGMEVWHVAGGG